MTLHLLRLDPDAQASTRWFAAENLLPRGGTDDGYAWHALLHAVFGRALAPKPFSVMTRRGRPPQLLAYTRDDPARLQEAARDFADPLALEALGLDPAAALAVRPMPAFARGRRLGFTLCARPTVRTDRDGDRSKSAEIDAYVAALRADPDSRPDRQAVYAAWLDARLAAGGARLLSGVRFDGLDRVPALRRDRTRMLRRVEGHAARFVGHLEVTDADAFAATLARGIGRHRAFGYGMLLLSPP